MSIIFIDPKRADLNAQLNLVKPAFNGVPGAKEEYKFCCDAVKDNRAGLYQVKGRGVNVRFVGIVTDCNEYLILALTGKGLINAAKTIIKVVSNNGYTAIKYHTVKAGMTRILRRFGFNVSEVSDDTVLTLDLGGC